MNQTTVDALKPLIHSNSMFSSPSLPNIAQVNGVDTKYSLVGYCIRNLAFFIKRGSSQFEPKSEYVVNADNRIDFID